MKKNSLVSETVDRCHRSCDKVNFPQRTRVYDITSFLLFDVYPSCIRTSFLLPHKDDQDPCSSATLPCHVSIVPCLPALNSHLDSNHTSCASNFPTVISNADSYEWPNQSPFHLLSTSLKNTICTSWNRISGQGAFDAFQSSSLLSSWDRVLRSDFIHTQTRWTASFSSSSFLTLKPVYDTIWCLVRVRYNLASWLDTIRSCDLFLYDINLRATHTTILSSGGAQIPIDLVSSATDSFW